MIHDSVLGCVGRTPLVRLSRLFPRADVEVLARFELVHPGGRGMDRRVHRLPVTIVVDPTITASNLRFLRQFGASVEMVRELVGEILGAVWVNQYAMDAVGSVIFGYPPSRRRLPGPRSPERERPTRIVAVLPDRGERYLDLVYPAVPGQEGRPCAPLST